MKITKLNKILVISLISTICIAAVLFSLVLNKANASEVESEQNQSYTVSVDLAGGVLDSAKPSGWTEKSSLYTKNFDEGTNFDTIMKE
ncbi:MAG: hypothetical protein Q4F54_01785 [Coriobacteriia bacterium]|nr:hypothetical protein [Coriobacteriia bacterium]